MARYVPIPPVSIDPRNEAELLNAALQKVFQASNGTINDFASGSPITALLEGQVYAQGELLYYLNRLPNAVVQEWIGPFLGSMRRTGSAATVTLTFTIETRDTPFVVDSGFSVTTSSAATGGLVATFITDENLVIAPGQGQGSVSATCAVLGSEGNVGANTITRFLSNLAGLVSVTNTEAASGGTDVETLEEVRERFYSLIRRPNPVSKEDWENFFIDLYGVGTVVSTIPRRSAQYEPISPSDEYGNVSFFVLKPNLSQPTSEDIKNIINLMRVSCPLEFEPHVYPVELNDIEIFADFQYDTNLGYARDLTSLSSTLRGYLTNVFNPDLYFPVGYNPSISDVIGALVSQIGSYTDPDVTSLKAYFTPRGVSKNILNPSKLSTFITSETLVVNDLVQQGTTYYPVIKAFSPDSGSQESEQVKGNLNLRKVKAWATTNNPFQAGEIILYNAGYYEVLEDFVYSSTKTFEQYQTTRNIATTAKTVVAWAVGSSYTTNNIILATTADFATTVDLVSQPLAWVPAQAFTVPQTTNTLANAQANLFVDPIAATVTTAVDGTTYTTGTYIQVQVTDALRGVLTLTYRVTSDFTYSTTTDFSAAVAEVSIFNESDFDALQYRYRPRFTVGEYLYDRVGLAYYQAARSFTPYTQDVATMVKDGYLLSLNFVPTTSRAIFRLIAGDIVSLISGRVTKQYEVQGSFTPVFESSAYINTSTPLLKERSDLPQTTAEFFDSSYNIESVIYTTDTGGLKFFRVLAPFTAPTQRTDWNGATVTNTARLEELYRNVLQIVDESSCEELIYARTTDSTSIINLGSANFKFTPKSGLSYVTQIVLEENGEVSYSDSVKTLTPIDYGTGTFSL